MTSAKERAELHLRLASDFATDSSHQNGSRHALHTDVAGLIMQVDDIEIELTMVSKALSQSENTERLARIEASIATLRTELQQEREAREEMAATVRELADAVAVLAVVGKTQIRPVYERVERERGGGVEDRSVFLNRDAAERGGNPYTHTVEVRVRAAVTDGTFFVFASKLEDAPAAPDMLDRMDPDYESDEEDCQ